MTAAARRSSLAAALRGRRVPLVVLAISLSLSVAGALGFRGASRARDESRMRNAIQATDDRIESRLQTYVALLAASRAMFAARDENVDPAHFRAFVDELDLPHRYPGIQGVGYTRAFAPADRAAVEAEMRRAGFDDFRVWPEGDRPELHAIVLLEPRDRRNHAAMGYDMATDPARRDAMDRARDSGQPAASGPVTLVQEIDPHKQAGFLIYVPVYRGERIPPSVAERRAALVGFVYSPFRIDDLLRGIFGSESAPLVGFSLRDRDAPSMLLHESAPRRDDAAFTGTSELAVAGRTWHLEFWSRREFERGSSRWLWPYVVLLGGAASALLFALSLHQARSAQERAELLEREQSLRAQAEAASRAKDEFVAMLGHELRNPLAPIVTALALLERRGGLAGARELVIIRRQVTYLRRLVDDLLDASAITRGKVALRKERVEVATAVQSAVEVVRPLVDQRRHTLRVDVAPGLFVDADEARLVQVLGNLLNNAAKYTEPGGHLAVSGAREDGDVVVRVRDDGQGIPPDTLERLFSLFEQGERGVDRAQGGLGIGLAVVRSLVQLHGGTVEGRSEGPGKGSEFVVRLPAAGASRASHAAIGAARTREHVDGRRVLVVDDNVDSADMMAEMLRLRGHTVSVAYDADEALRLASQQPYDVAVLDIGLPGMDGYRLAARLRHGRAPTLVAVTGYGQERDRQRAREAGFAHHLVKPVDPTQLVAVVASARAA